MTTMWRRAEPRRLLLMLCAGLGAVVAVELVFPGLLRPAVQPAPAGETAARLSWSAPELPALDAFPNAVERPLFSPSRTGAGGAVAVADAGPAAVGSLSTVALMGIVTSGRGRIAVFRSPEATQALRLREGAEIAGWEIDRILADRVVLSRAGQSQEMRLNGSDDTRS